MAVKHLADTKHFVNELAKDCAFGRHSGWPPAADPEVTIQEKAESFADEVCEELEYDNLENARLIERVNNFVQHMNGIMPLFDAHHFGEYYTNRFMEHGLRRIFNTRLQEMTDQQRQDWEEQLDAAY